jgi:hypothetical protein
MDQKLKAVLDRATDYTGSKKRKVGKGILGVVIVLLLGALGMEVSNNDFDLGAILGGQSMSESKIERNVDGNLNRTDDGGFVTRVMRDKTGAVVPEGQAGGKYTDEYNCDDFTTQGEAQTFYRNAGGANGDVNRLDGDKDGQACVSLPKGAK